MKGKEGWFVREVGTLFKVKYVTEIILSLFLAPPARIDGCISHSQCRCYVNDVLGDRMLRKQAYVLSPQIIN